MTKNLAIQFHALAANYRSILGAESRCDGECRIHLGRMQSLWKSFNGVRNHLTSSKIIQPGSSKVCIVSSHDAFVRFAGCVCVYKLRILME